MLQKALITDPIPIEKNHPRHHTNAGDLLSDFNKLPLEFVLLLFLILHPSDSARLLMPDQVPWSLRQS